MACCWARACWSASCCWGVIEAMEDIMDDARLEADIPEPMREWAEPMEAEAGDLMRGEGV